MTGKGIIDDDGTIRGSRIIHPAEKSLGHRTGKHQDDADDHQRADDQQQDLQDFQTLDGFMLHLFQEPDRAEINYLDIAAVQDMDDQRNAGQRQHPEK